MKEVLLGKVDGVKFEPNLKGWRKTGRKSIIDMNYQEKQIIADMVESGIIKLTSWQLVNYHREVKDIPSLYISAAGNCISKLKPLVEKAKNEKQVSLDISAPTYKSKFLQCLQFSFQMNLMNLGGALKLLVENKIIKTKEGKLTKQFIPII